MEKKNEIVNDYSLTQMLRDFYCSKMETIVVVAWLYSVVFIALTVFFAFRFAGAQTTKGQIIYAALIVIMVQSLFLIKIFCWQFIHRNALLRRLERIENILSQEKSA